MTTEQLLLRPQLTPRPKHIVFNRLFPMKYLRKMKQWEFVGIWYRWN